VKLDMSLTQKKLLILSLLIALLSISHASAYIGPATASMIWQVMLAAVLSLGYLVHLYWFRIMNIFKNKPEKSSNKSVDQE
jgi:hypothetical protein